MTEYLTINHFIPISQVNGPGKRFTIWFQGCSFNCDGCFNKELRSKKAGVKYKIDKIVDVILGTKDIEGVTYTGGEPFLQSEELILLSKMLKKHSLSIVSYTGFTYEDIIKLNDKSKTELLSLLDILIDGKFIKSLPPNKPWIGSSNQRVLFLTNRYMYLKNKLAQKCEEFELHINKNGKILITGLPDQALLNEL